MYKRVQIIIQVHMQTYVLLLLGNNSRLHRHEIDSFYFSFLRVLQAEVHSLS